MPTKSICSELVSLAKSLKSAEFAKKHARSKPSTATVNQPIVRKPRLFNRVDFSRFLLFFQFLFHFTGLTKPIAFVSFLFLFCVRRRESVDEVKV
jgi:hypothetical protein